MKDHGLPLKGNFETLNTAYDLPSKYSEFCVLIVHLFFLNSTRT